MKQLLQHLGTGVTEVADVPVPALRPGYVLIRTTRSLVSPGTERMLRDFGRANLVQKALSQPARAREVVQKARTDGLVATMEAVKSKLDQPIPLGYCNVGRVAGIGAGVTGLQPGDRVVSNGAHAEAVLVPRNLVVRIPDPVDDDMAAFTVLGAIALNGIRLAQVELGSCAAVFGLGLVGLIAVQLLRAQGVRVFGTDIDPGRCAIGKTFGAECVHAASDTLMQRAREFSRGRGVDAVLICAATKSNDPILQAGKIARQKGRVILVGTAGLEIARDDFFRKELSFAVSCSYGPGRYDPEYEEAGRDYPVGFVRWTAQRNFEAVLDMMAAGRLDIAPLLSARFPIAHAAKAYEQLDAGGSKLGILLDYPEERHAPGLMLERSIAMAPPRAAAVSGALTVGLIGAGNYAARHLIPALRMAGADLRVICAAGGVSAAHAGRKFGFTRATSDTAEVLDAEDIDLVVIATRHDSHASLVTKALRAGRAVFVEKPLALTKAELEEIESAYVESDTPFLMVGFNRRFSPHVVEVKQGIAAAGAVPAIIITVNAGAIPAEHWTQNIRNGGRIVGEACHFIDLARHLAGAPIASFDAVRLGASTADENPEDKAFITLRFANGAAASIQYLANGHRSFPKERVEVFCGGKVWRIDNFRHLVGFGAHGKGGGLLRGQDKGQPAMIAGMIAALRAGQPLIPIAELTEVAAATIDIDQRLRGL